MDIIPTAVCLTTYDGGPKDFMLTPLDELVEQVAAGTLHVQVGRVFKLDDIVEAHRCMEDNSAGGKSSANPSTTMSVAGLGTGSGGPPDPHSSGRRTKAVR
jgi:hypothetical protein